MDLWSLIAPIAAQLHDHAYGAALLGAFLLLGNLLLRVKTPAQWYVLLDGYPRLHAAFEVVRALGIQPVELFNALGRIITGKAPPPPPPPASKTGPSAGSFVAGATMLALAMLVGACALLSPASFPDEQKALACIEGSYTLGEAFEAFVIEAALRCGLAVEAVVADVLKSPSLSAYHDAARAAQADPAKMGALKSKLAARRLEAR